MENIRTTFIGLIAVVITGFISNFTGNLFFTELKIEIKEDGQILITLLGFMILMLTGCLIALCYNIGKLINLFRK